VATAICIRCGFEKRRASSRCGHCGLNPRHDLHALAKSVILSVERFEDGTDRLRYASDLDKLGESLRSGGAVGYDSKEVERLAGSAKEGQTLAWWVGLKAFSMVMLWLAPLWLIVAVAVWLWLHR
jgi:hypothetical protein